VRLRDGQTALAPALLRALARTWSDGHAAFSARLSISDRLAVAFAAVAVMAVVANLVVEHGTTTLVTVIKPPDPPIRIVVTEPPRIVPATAPVVTPPVVETVIDEKPAITALQDFERLVVRQATAQDPENPELLQGAAGRLNSEVATFFEHSAASDRGIRHRVSTLVSDGSSIARVASSRRALGASYSTHFENLDTQMQAALEGSWKIFGRVITRQSLVSLSHALDEVRRRSSMLASSRAEERTTLDDLAAAQREFAAALEQNSQGLERSQGAPWLADVRQNLSLLQSDTRQLTSLYDADTPTLDSFQSSTQGLETSLHLSAQAARTAHARRAPAPAATLHHAAAPAQQPPLEPLEISAHKIPLPPPAPAPARVDHIRIIIAAISVAVLLLVFLVSVATVRSIARPIRAFMKVTERLAAGDLRARFTRCGVRELDVLAVAFNRMAEKLAATQDVTREHQAHLELSVDERTRELQHLAEHDPLTGLPNRRQLLSHLEKLLSQADVEQFQVAVFFLDLDNFKNINDSMGHAFGDLVLKAVAQRLQEASGTAGFAARLGGDEFTVICRGAGTTEALAAIGETLVGAFQKPLLIEGRELLVSASVGASVYPDHERDSGALMRAADAALFQAKNLGRSRLSIFSRDLLENASVKFRTEQGLRRAVERNEWELLFQPEVSFDTLSVKLVEALIRWRLPDGRQVSPIEFMTVAEESGLITTINEWVLRSAIECCARWRHGAWPEARIAVNITARQLLDSGFVPRFAALLAEHRLQPRCIEIELTETVLQTGPGTIQTLNQLRELGVSVALDDFGCGYSSLASLEQLPLTRVKLDRSLIASIDTSMRSLAIARAIIGLCANLELEVTAEGIERPEQLALLLAFPALSLQGYLISRPLPEAAIPEFLANTPQHLHGLMLEVPPAEVPELIALPARLAKQGNS
jgi:diguanylate cyclase (GGDEF)-like protein